MSDLPARRQPAVRSAFTLVEMLVAMVLTLIMVAAIAEFYAYVGDTVRDGRAMIEMSGQLRAAVQRLKGDLDQITSSVVPWADDGSAQGYFEYKEGIASDYDANGNYRFDATVDEDSDANLQNDLLQRGATDLVGDCDDYLAFTIRSNGAPFTGRRYVAGTYIPVSSQLAEVVWFTGFSDLNANGTWDFEEPRTIHRRLLLIIPGLTLTKPTTYTPPNVAPPNDNVFHHNDISAHFDASGNAISNSLSELTRRENRFAHQSGANNFPNALLLQPGYSTSPGYPDYALTLATYTLQTDVLGEDVVLSNVLAFDVRVYDPEAVLRADAATGGANPAANALAPPDSGYLKAMVDGNPIVGTGAYVDLGYGAKFLQQLQQPPFGMSASAASTLLGTSLGSSPRYYADLPAGHPGYNAVALRNYRDTIGYTYDTWSLSYERDGINQDWQADNVANSNTPPFDEGTNGVDDPDAGGNYTNGVDDYAERETVPPYPQPLRGLQVKIRLYEPSTRQVRQATVTTDFLAE